MADQPKSTPPPRENAFRAAYLALIETPDDHAAARRFGELLCSVLYEGRAAVMIPPTQRAESDARQSVAAVVADLRQTMVDLRGLAEFRSEIDDARAAVVAHDALPVLEQVAAKLDATFAETD